MNMGDDAHTAKSAEAHLFVNMGDSALTAKSVEALLFVNTGADALNASVVSIPTFRITHIFDNSASGVNFVDTSTFFRGLFVFISCTIMF